jgi:hypothetical protein
MARQGRGDLQVDVLVRPHILSTREAATLTLPEGTSLQTMVGAYGWPPGVESNVVCLVNGEMVPRQWWGRVRPKAGSQVLITLRLHGGKKNKSILALVASIAVAFVAPYATAAMGFTGGMATAVTAGISIVGNLAINALIKPPSINTGSQAAADERSGTYSLTGQSNAMRPYGVIPRVYGTHRFYPDLCAVPYTTTEGNNQYLTCMYCLGYSPLEVEDLRIGTDPIGNYDGVQIYEHTHFLAGSPLYLYTNDTWQESYSLVLNTWNSAVITTRPDTDYATIDIAFTTGLGYLNDAGGVDGRSASHKIYYKRADQSQAYWKAFGSAPWYTWSEGFVPTNGAGYIQGVYRTQYSGGNATSYGYTAFAKGRTEFPARWDGNPPLPGSTLKIGKHTLYVQSAGWGNVVVDPVPGGFNISNTDSGGWARCSFTHPGADGWTISRGTAEPFIISFTIGFPYRDQWELAIHQIDPDSTSSRELRDRTVSALKSFTNVPPIAPDKHMHIIELRVKASDQLSGVLDNFNCLATSVLPAWENGAWTWAPTSNPAAIFLNLLDGAPNKKPLGSNRIDYEALQRWSERNDRIQPGFSQPNASCNFVVDKSYTLWQLLSSVAACGRASPTMRDNKYSVIIDEEDLTPVQTFTPRNCWNLSSSRNYLDIPHALRVKWIDPTSDYKPADAVVYDTGFNASNATIFEDLETFGCTNHEQAIREGRVALARAQLQQESFSIETDIENLVCTRGDMVYIAHDVLQVGGWSARIAGISGSTVTADADLIGYATPLGIQFRSDQGVISAAIAATLTGARTLTCTVPASAQVGDLFLYGTLNRIIGKYFVKSVQPGNDLTATLDLVEYAPGIYQAERSGAFPEYKPQPRSLATFYPNPVQNAYYKITQFIDVRFPKATATLYWTAPVNKVLPKFYIINQVLEDGTILEIGRPLATKFSPLIGVEVWQGQYRGAVITYEIIPVWTGQKGPAVRVAVTMPTVALLPPLPLIDFTVTVEPRNVEVEWDASTDQYLAYYVVRYAKAPATWEAAGKDIKIKANSISLGASFETGTHVVFVCQEDRFNLRSTAVSKTFTVSNPKAIPLAGAGAANTAFLRWGSLAVPSGEWSAQTTFQIEYYEVSKELIDVPSAQLLPVGETEPLMLMDSLGPIYPETIEAIRSRSRFRFASPGSSTVGRYSGEFAVLDERQAGDWEYCVRGVDTAGNTGPETCIRLTLETPDNYFLLDDVPNLLTQPQTTVTGGVDTDIPFQYLMPVNSAETWEQHFTSRAWSTIDDQISAGFPYYAQPAAASGLSVWEFDYLKVLPPLRVTTQPHYTVLTGSPFVTSRILSRAKTADPWTLIASGAGEITGLMAPGTQYVRIETEVMTDAATKGLLTLTKISYRIDVRYKQDSGSITLPGSGVGTVAFNVPFTDVRSVALTSMAPAIAFTRAEVATDQLSMTVYGFSPAAAPAGGLVSWAVRGI